VVQPFRARRGVNSIPLPSSAQHLLWIQAVSRRFGGFFRGAFLSSFFQGQVSLHLLAWPTFNPELASRIAMGEA
jgi:hypothetical protein